MDTMTIPSLSETDLSDLNALTRVSLGDLIRAGSHVTEQRVGDWGSAEEACALAAAAIAMHDLMRR